MYELYQIRVVDRVPVMEWVDGFKTLPSALQHTLALWGEDASVEALLIHDSEGKLAAIVGKDKSGSKKLTTY